MGKENRESTSSDKKTQLLALTIPALVAVFAAILGLLGTFLTLVFNFPPFVRLFDPTPTSMPTSVVETITPPWLDVQTPIPTTTLALPFSTETLPASSSPTTGLPLGMQVILTATRTQGQVPLSVRFDARDSFLRTADGTIYECGACNYTWTVRESGLYVLGPKETDGTLEYKFTRRGTYFVSVTVCRAGSVVDCGGSGSMIVAQ